MNCSKSGDGRTDGMSAVTQMRLVSTVYVCVSLLSIAVGPQVAENPDFAQFNDALRCSLMLRVCLSACTAVTLPMLLDMLLDALYYEDVFKHLAERAMFAVSFLICGVAPLLCFDSPRLSQIYIAINQCQNIIITAATTIVLHKLQPQDFTAGRSLAVLTVYGASQAVGAWTLNLGSLIYVTPVNVLLYGVYFTYLLLIAAATRTIYRRGRDASSGDTISLVFMHSTLVYALALFVYSNMNDVTYLTSRSAQDLTVTTYIQLVLTVLLVVLPSRLARYEVMHVEQALNARKLLSRHMYHEMRTPLNIVVMGLELLADALVQRRKLLPQESQEAKEEDAETADLLDHITLACSTTIEILNDMLVYDKLDSGAFALDLAFFSVAPLVQEAVKPFELQARNKGVRIKITDRTRSKSGGGGGSASSAAGSSKVSVGTACAADAAIEEPPADALAADDADHNAGTLASAAALIASMRLTPAGSVTAAQQAASHAAGLVGDIPKYHVKVDPVKMGQVLHSFLSNAIQHTPAGGSINVVVRIMPGRKSQVAASRRSSYSARLVRWMKRCLAASRRRRGMSVLPITGSGAVSPASSTTVTPRRSDSTGSDTSDVSSLSLTARSRSLRRRRQPSLNLFQRDPLQPTVRISVTDTGEGMSAHDLSQLFYDRELSKSGELQGGGGSGFALQIAKGIVELHGGSVGASSNGIGKGSTFYVDLPLYTFVPPTDISDLGGMLAGVREAVVGVDGRPISVGSRGESEGKVGQASLAYNEGADRQAMVMYPLGLRSSADGLQLTATAKADYGLKRVLLVDDSDLCRRMVRRLLTALDADMVIDDVGCGQDCVDMVRRRREEQLAHPDSSSNSAGAEIPDYYDLIILDNQMPGLSGPQTAAELRRGTGAGGCGHNGLIIGLSGLADERDMKEFVDAGADVVLVKPINSGVLLRTLILHKK